MIILIALGINTTNLSYNFRLNVFPGLQLGLELATGDSCFRKAVISSLNSSNLYNILIYGVITKLEIIFKRSTINIKERNYN